MEKKYLKRETDNERRRAGEGGAEQTVSVVSHRETDYWVKSGIIIRHKVEVS